MKSSSPGNIVIIPLDDAVISWLVRVGKQAAGEYRTEGCRVGRPLDRADLLYRTVIEIASPSMFTTSDPVLTAWKRIARAGTIPPHNRLMRDAT
ncbi:MAG TPA: hypothetical protein VEQ63_02340, partial [Bryobacteraceae bacterium]|nr:hypothetical protein [Bryobacteraceae bacterium]